MGLETGSFIDDLVVTNPTTTDKRRQGDDHFRLIKNVLKNTFPNLTGAMNATQVELNYMVGVTSLVQTQMDTKHDAVGIGLVEDDATTPSVGQGNGILVNASDVALGDLGDLAAILGSALDEDDGRLVDDDGTPKRVAFTDDGLRIIDETTTSRTLVTADMNSYIECANSSAQAIVLDTGVGKKGNFIVIEQFGAGQVTVSGTSTINGANGLKTAVQYSVIVLICKATDVWTLAGDAVV